MAFLKKILRGAVSGMTAAPRGIKAVVTGKAKDFKVIDTNQSVKKSLIDQYQANIGIATVVVGGTLASQKLKPESYSPTTPTSGSVTGIPQKPKVETIKSVTAPIAKNIVETKKPRKMAKFKEKVKSLSNRAKQKAASLKQNITASQPSGSLKFGKDSNLAWLPFAIIGGLVLVLLIRPFTAKSGRRR